MFNEREAQMVNLLISKRAANVFGLNSRRIEAVSIEQAAQLWSSMRDASCCGVSEIGNGGNVLDSNGKKIASVSYNGRIWQ